MEIRHPSPSLIYTTAVHKTTLEASPADDQELVFSSDTLDSQLTGTLSLHSQSTLKHFLTIGEEHRLGSEQKK